MPDRSHSETEAVEEKTVFVAAVASQAVVKSTQLVIEYSAEPARGLDEMSSMKENLFPGAGTPARSPERERRQPTLETLHSRT